MQTQQHISLEDLSSFHSRGVAQEYVKISSEEDVLTLSQKLQASWEYKKNIAHYLLWKGCNTLFDGDFQGLIIQNAILWIEVIEETDDEIILKVGGGEDWVNFVKYCVKNKYAGIENLSEIPWTVGAAPVQNIGAYGVEIAEVIHEVQGIDLRTGEKKIFSCAECQFGYRESIFKSESAGLKNNFLISYVVLKLKKYDAEKKNYCLNMNYADIQKYIADNNLDKETLWIAELSDIITVIRQGKLPNLDERGTAGSFFKNPIISEQQYTTLLEQFPILKCYPVMNAEKYVKIPAAQLIDLVGMKWVLEDGVGTYKHHALILVSQWVQDGKKIVNFAKKVQEKVEATFGIMLEPEVNII